MLEQNEIRFRARKFSDDFVWFGKGGVDSSWMDNYKNLFFKTDNDIQIFVEFNEDSYRLYFDKILSDPSRVDKDKRQLYYVLIANGKRGSESSKFLNKLIKFYFKDKVRLSQLFDDAFAMDFIESVYENAKTEEVGNLIIEKLDFISSQIEDYPIDAALGIESNKYVFDKDSNDNLEKFFAELSKLGTIEKVEGTVSLVYTQESIEEQYLENFSIDGFSKGLCLTCKYSKMFKPIERIICQPKNSVDKLETSNSVDPITPPNTSGMSPDNVDESLNPINDGKDEPSKNVGGASNPFNWKPVLILFLLLFVIIVKSCS